MPISKTNALTRLRVARDMNRKKCSSKSYAYSVCLSAIFGFVGVQHFYLGRYLEGLIDVWLTAAWIYCFFVAGKPVLGAIALSADLIHSFVVTIMLLTGNFKDGEGRIICYPGQELS